LKKKLIFKNETRFHFFSYFPISVSQIPTDFQVYQSISAVSNRQLVRLRSELTGKYFSDNSYAYIRLNPQSFLLRCKKGDALEQDRILTEKGVFDFE